MMNALETLIENGCSDSIISAILADMVENASFDDDDDCKMCVALAWYRENEGSAGPSDCRYHGDIYKIAQCEYWVLTDDEADTAFDAYLDQMLEDDGLVPGASSRYFDTESWKRDMVLGCGRGIMAGYDGNEEELGDYFIYRVN